MAKLKKKTVLIYFGSFAATILAVCLLVLVIFKGVFYSTYYKKGNSYFAEGNYTQAVKSYNTAKMWKPGKQEVYVALSSAYSAQGLYDKAGAEIDTAINKKLTTADSGLEQLYIMRIRIYSASGQLIDAVNYTDSIADQYILRKIQEIRPADIVYTPTKGNYDRTQKMKITVADGLTVYYTTDGTYPTKNSGVYSEPVNIGNGKTDINAIALSADGLVSPLLSVTYNVTNENETVSFDDAKIEKMVRSALSKPTGVIRVKELEAVTELSNDGIDGNVKTLSDLDMMPNIRTLNLDGESMLISISQISGKTKLENLILSGCGLDNTDTDALGSLSALKTLDLSNNSLSSISFLSNIQTLTYVYLAKNNIDDLSPLSASKSIEFIDASQNRIAELPDFDSVSSLRTLILGSNRISDISTAHRFSSLVYLDLSKNQIKSAKILAALTKLETLDVSGNSIGNFDFLSSLKQLTSLNVDDTSFINTKPLSAMKLVSFSASGTGLVSLDGLSASTELKSLEIADTNVTTIAVIKTFQKLDYLDISGCKITDLSVLSELSGLYTIKAVGVDLKNITFKNPQVQIVS